MASGNGNEAGVATRAPDERRSGKGRRGYDRRDASFLADVSRLLADSLDYETTLGNVAMLSLPHLGAWCIVDVVEEDGGIRRVAIIHPDPEKQRIARTLRDGWPPTRDDPLGVPAVARTRASEIVPQVGEELLRRMARTDRNLELLRKLGIGSLMMVPLVARGDVLGAITFVAPQEGHHYGKGDLALAEDLATRAAVAIDNARLYRAAERAREAAERASRAKSEFLGIMSHELRTPINAILGYTQLLDLGVRGGLTDEQRALLQRVDASGRHLLELVTRLLDMSKSQAGELTVHTEVNLADEVISGAVNMVRPEAGPRRIECRWDADTSLRFLGDGIRVRQILGHLLTNAIQATAEDGHIQVTCERVEEDLTPERLRGQTGPWLRISVQDDGPGIPDDRIDAIFEPFVQGDSSPLVRERDGTGLGLALSLNLARAMGGELSVVSRGGEGSRFSLWLPAPRSARVRRERRLFRRDATGLQHLSDHLLRRLKPIIDAYTDRLRQDGGVPRAGEASDVALRDHIPHFLSGVASLLTHSGEAGPEVSAVLQGGNAIQRLTLELHGAERHGMGWSQDAVRRDLAILRDVIIDDLRSDAPDDADLDAITVVLGRLFEQAERISLQGWHYARSDNPTVLRGREEASSSVEQET
jgi:signal transduction histidine kinase